MLRQFKAALYPLTIGCLLAAVLLSLHSQGVSNCHQIENLKKAERTSLILAASRVGMPGTATYSFYQTHPADLRSARLLNITREHIFAPHSCP